MAAVSASAPHRGRRTQVKNLTTRAAPSVPLHQLVAHPAARQKRQAPAWALAIKARRVEVCGSQETLASTVQTSQSLISQIERGVQDPRTLAQARFSRLLAALKWSPEDFCFHTGLAMTLPPQTRQPESEEFSPGLRETIAGYGARFPDLHAPHWVGLLEQFEVEGDHPQAWLQLYLGLASLPGQLRGDLGRRAPAGARP